MNIVQNSRANISLSQIYPYQRIYIVQYENLIFKSYKYRMEKVSLESEWR